MDDVNRERKAFLSRGKRFAVVVLLLGIGAFLLWLPTNRSARTAAHRAQSLNNVKNLALAQKNFCSQHDGLFATPTLTNEKGEPVHGWVTQTLLYLDNRAIYDRINFDVPWDHPDNQEISQVQLRVCLNPALDDQESNAAGYPLVHYTLNSRLFPDNVAVTEDFVARSDGLSNTIMMGEIQEGLPPWAAPGNARDPALGLKPGPKTMGVDVWDGVTVIGFADGRVRTLNNDIDPAVLKALATPDGGEEIPEEW